VPNADSCPWVRIEKPYVFEAPERQCTRGDLFRGRSQLAVYHFMLTPGSDHVGRGCSFVADHVDAAWHAFRACRPFACRGPARAASADRGGQGPDGLDVPRVSSQGSDFNFDLGISFTPEDMAAGRAIYNYGTVIRNSPDMFSTSIFVKDDRSAIFHSYPIYHRGAELLMGAFNWLDLVPSGRNESAGTMSWVRRHDEY
jgi:predicted dithiol-disulfide oxidoreductase (DUF899 family)